MEKKEALANYLECEVDDIQDGYDSDWFEYNGDEYRVLTDEEADQAVVEDIENLMDDVGLDAFTESMQNWIIENAISDSDFFADAQRESAEIYVQDIENENDRTYENRLIAELVENGYLDEEDDFHFDEDDEDQEYPLLNDDVDLDDAKEEYIDSMCEEDPYEWYVWNFGSDDIRNLIREGRLSFDYDAIAEECISWDGRGHSLSSYDGEEIELGDGLYAYKN